MRILILDHLYFLQDQLLQIENLRTPGPVTFLQDYTIEFTPDDYSIFRFCWFPDQFAHDDPISYGLVRIQEPITGLTTRLSCSLLQAYKVSPDGDDLLNIGPYIDKFRTAYESIQSGQDPDIEGLPTWMVCVVLHWKYSYQNTYTLGDFLQLQLDDNLSRTFAYVSVKKQLSQFVETQKLRSLP